MEVETGDTEAVLELLKWGLEGESYQRSEFRARGKVFLSRELLY